ncbi:hypothetical protein JCM10212_006010 [Sporobolomyces blumeae]
MRVHEGIDGTAFAGKVLKLDRAIHGLKHAGRVRNSHIKATLRALGYSRTEFNACVSVREAGGQHHYIARYMDNLLSVFNSFNEISRCKDGLRQEYGIKNLAKAKFISRIQIHRRGDGYIFLSQHV